MNQCKSVYTRVRPSTGKLDSWRCKLDAGHPGPHTSGYTGRRTWEDGDPGVRHG